MTNLENLGGPISIELDPRHNYVGKHINVEIVERDNDLIYHMGNPHEDFRQILTEVVNDFFSDTDTFGIDYIPEMDNFSLYALNAANDPMGNPVHKAKKFLALLDQTIGVINDSLANR